MSFSCHALVTGNAADTAAGMAMFGVILDALGDRNDVTGDLWRWIALVGSKCDHRADYRGSRLRRSDCNGNSPNA